LYTISDLNPGAAQQSVAASSPYGANMTDLMHHVEFFDENKDGIITITESVKGS
jgi:peroxygenase